MRKDGEFELDMCLRHLCDIQVRDRRQMNIRARAPRTASGLEIHNGRSLPDSDGHLDTAPRGTRLQRCVGGVIRCSHQGDGFFLLKNNRNF